MLFRSMAAVAAFLFAGAVHAQDARKPKLLVITESKGFVHSVVKRPAPDTFCSVEKALTKLGNETGDFEAVCSQDSRKEITAENLAKYDAVFFYTTGNLPLSETQKADLLSYVRSGKGFSGSHCATDTFYQWPDYGNLIGAYFDGHPWHTKVKVLVEDPANPATKELGASFEITDELYQFRTPYDRSKLRVIMRIDPAWAKERRLEELAQIEKSRNDLPARIKQLADSGKKDEAEKLKKQVEGRKSGVHRQDDDHALAWVRDYGKGRVFYTALGHREEVWANPLFLKHIRGGLRYALGLDKADASPRPAPVN
ncbi:MAG: ThuA domain-containing protein [Planctomycetes bacterium]|nr:ThuA domain-containing protein [Planctomycetota bacterium]